VAQAGINMNISQIAGGFWRRWRSALRATAGAGAKAAAARVGRAAVAAASAVAAGVTLAALCAAAPAAHAGNLTYSGTIDSGPLAGQRYSGAFTYTDPAVGFEGSVPLASLSLSFSGQTYSLADADAGTTASARFVAGQLVGIDVVAIRAANTTRPGMQFTAGFFAFSEASFSYDLGAGTAGFGSYATTPVLTVAEPGGLSLVLIGLLGLAARRRFRGSLGRAVGSPLRSSLRARLSGATAARQHAS
jgi:hypothetical protein